MSRAFSVATDASQRHTWRLHPANGLIAGSKGSGKCGPNSVLGQLAHAVSTATADTARGQRVRNLLAELADVRADQAMADRFNPLTTRAWKAELACEAADVWRHIADALTAPARGDEGASA